MIEGDTGKLRESEDRVLLLGLEMQKSLVKEMGGLQDEEGLNREGRGEEMKSDAASIATIACYQLHTGGRKREWIKADLAYICCF